MPASRSLSLVLAAGEGTRMRSATPKVLHRLGGRALIAHVLSAVRESGGDVAAVIAPGHDAVAAEIRRVVPTAAIFVQQVPRGTADAVLAARRAIDGVDRVVVLYGDTPLIRPVTLSRLRHALDGGAAVAVLGFRARDPAGYGRLVTVGEQLLAIREEQDASPEERQITLCNSGVMALGGAHALAILDRIEADNRKGEFYLTDAVATARSLGLQVVKLETEEDEVQGINTRAQLAAAEAALQQRLRQQWLDHGVTMVAPETVFFSADTRLARDVVIEPHVVFGPGVVVEEGATIRSFSHIEGAHIGEGARVGPFARLRPGADLGSEVHVGNFVEVKAATIAAGAKANHLAYIGDARVGEGTNVGAGTIFCNYDGVAKHHTEVGRDVFIGSNAALVAPVSIGDGAYVATGSVVTDDVPADALVIARSRQVIKENRAARLRGAKAAAAKSHPAK